MTEEILSRAADDRAHQNARRNSDAQNVRMDHDKALLRVITALM